MLCPFCLSEVIFQENVEGSRISYFCPECKEGIPVLYVQEYKRYPPLVVNAIGFRGHGKTVYFASLFYALRKQQLSRFWKGFHTMCLTEESLEIVLKNVNMLEEGFLPESTPKNFPRPTIVRLQGIPTYPNRTLLFYDTSGEAFEKASQLVQFASFVKKAQKVLFLLSISDMEDVGMEMHNLLNTYIIGMSDLGGKTKTQELIVVYTKADKISNYLNKFSKVIDYLREGTVDGLSNMKNYHKKMREISEELYQFTQKTIKAYEFINAAEVHFQAVHFCIISALGANPQGDRLAVTITPRRIFDPLFWLMGEPTSWWKRWWR